MGHIKEPYGVDFVVESTGHFLDVETCSLHLKAGAKRVIITAVNSMQQIH